MNFNFLRNKGIALIVENPKTAFWSVVGTAGVGIIGVIVHKYKKKADTEAELVKAIQDGEIAIRKKRNDTECDILATAAQTACEMMKQATSLAPELKGIKEEFKAIREEMEVMRHHPTPEDYSNDDDSYDASNYQGRSSAELFNRTHVDNSKWIVDGYMKVGLVNLIVAGGGVGKTIFMVQTAIAVDKGIRPEFLPPECCASAELHVVYYRLEDFSDELEGKYGKGMVLKESGIIWFLPEHLPEFSLSGFISHLKGLASTLTGDTLICVDPATKLDGYKHTEFIKGVEEAQNIAKEKGVILTIAASIHLDEIKDWTALTNCDIKGGDKGLQLAGSVTALRRERTDNDHRFLQCLKEPKGSRKPFDGKVLVCKAVEEMLDENNKYLHYKFVCTKPEEQARPEKPTLQPDESDASPSVNKPKKRAPNQKITSEMEDYILDSTLAGKDVSEIVDYVMKHNPKPLSEGYLEKYLRNLGK